MTKDTERNENEQDDLNSTTVESKGKGERTEKKENAEN